MIDAVAAFPYLLIAIFALGACWLVTARARAKARRACFRKLGELAVELELFRKSWTD